MDAVKRLTGTHVYSFAKCPRLAALDLHLPRSERRPPHAWEEFAARRGRDFEARHVAGLGAVAPLYPERDFEAGAAATLELLREGAPLVHQAVLTCGDRLGLPDLLRRLPGASRFGEHHYEVIDLKTSGRARSDQILQVVFYSRLLAEVQGRAPLCAALVLKDGREHRFAVADYEAACADVEAELRLLRGDLDAARPFAQYGCESCHWDHRCLPELEAAGDLSLVQGMTRGARAILEGLGCTTVAELAAFHPEGPRARGQLDPVLLRRLRRAAQAAMDGRPFAEPRPRAALDPAAIVHLLADPFADRVLLFGILHPARPDGEVRVARPRGRAGEVSALAELLAPVPAGAAVLHFGGALPRWYEDHSFEREADAGLAARFVDLQRRLRGAALWPRPVFSLADLVRQGLGRDPARAGVAAAAAMWETDGDAEAKLVAKMRADLHDLAELKQRYLDPEPAAREAALGSDPGTAAAPLPGP